MTDYVAEIDELLEAADDPTAPRCIAPLERALQIADFHRDRAQGLRVRDQFVTIAILSGFPHKALTAFTWMLGHFDQDPELEAEWAERLESNYGLIAQNVPHFPQVSRRQIDDMFADMQRRLGRLGIDPTYTEMARLVAAIMLGDQDATRERFQQWRDLFNVHGGCKLCAGDLTAMTLFFLGEREQGLQQAMAILNGPESCWCDVPMMTGARVLLPLFESGRMEEAVAQYRRWHRRVRGSHGYLNTVSHVIEFLVLTGNLAAAVEIWKHKLEEGLNTRKHRYQFQYQLASRQLMRSLLASGRDSLGARLPAAFPLHDPRGRYRVEAIANWFDAQAAALAAAFDQRNGNAYHAHWMDRSLARLSQARSWPLEDSST